jgi:hypothetical protein
MKGLITLNGKEAHRARVLEQVASGTVTLKEAARFGRSARSYRMPVPAGLFTAVARRDRNIPAGNDIPMGFAGTSSTRAGSPPRRRGW